MNLKVGQRVRVNFSPRGRGGVGLRVTPRSALWKSSNEAVAVVIPDETNELSALVMAATPGIVLISVCARAQDGGNRNLNLKGVGALVVTEEPSDLGSELTFSTPEEIPE
jgi:hypothetical protein